MSAFAARPGSRFRRPRLAAALLLIAAAGAYAFTQLGRFMAPDEPLEKADIIFVLAGTLAERPLEAADLYREGYAPRIMVTRAAAEQAIQIAERRGVTVPGALDTTREMLLQLGIPESALVIPEKVHDNTADEARTLRQYADRLGWRRVIVVSSKYHMRRVGLAMHREFGDRPVDIILRGSRYDPSIPGRWWEHRNDIRWLLSEVPKYSAYLMGLGAD